VVSEDGNRRSTVAVLQGGYFVATGLWPLVSRRTFERVTGPKADFWLAQTVGVLVTGIGGVLLLGEKRGRLTPEIELLGAASAAALGLVDLVFALRGRISKVYLVDAAAEVALVAGWARRRAGERDGSR
jgi:glucose uptake protein GlcU